MKLISITLKHSTSYVLYVAFRHSSSVKLQYVANLTNKSTLKKP